MTLALAPCPPARRAELDAFFAAGFPSLGAIPAGRRFPAVEPLAALDAEGGFVAACALRPFAFHAQEKRWRGAMVGLVLVAAAARGRGIGGELMRGAEAHARTAGDQVGVLWTGRHGFYGRLGWELADLGGTVEAPGRGGSPPPPPPDAAAWAAIDALGPPPVLERDRRALPPPAVALEAHLDPAGRAYALAGRTPDRGYVLELEGHPEGFDAVWDSLVAAHARLLVNVRPGSAAEGWLTARGLRPARRPLAMWRRLDPAAPWGWHVPWFDRI